CLPGTTSFPYTTLFRSRFEARGASFWLAGVDDYMAGKTDVTAALRGSFPDEMKLLLAHNPVIFRQAVRANIDLTLSGHTHGGQRSEEHTSELQSRSDLV